LIIPTPLIRGRVPLKTYIYLVLGSKIAQDLDLIEIFYKNQFTSQSDIWSFGITLWEVTTSCLTLPYSLLNDEEVYQRLKSLNGLHLSKPECLSKELIDLMLECWRPWNERPTFQEIYNFFNKRLYGVNIV
jgi:serine/threonine protein kinase